MAVFEVYLYKRAVLFSEHGLSSKDFGVPNRLMGLVVNYCLIEKAPCNRYHWQNSLDLEFFFYLFSKLA